MAPTRREWIAGALCACVVAIMLFWSNVGSASSPELRIAASDGALSTLVIAGDQRILIMNAMGPQDARATIGLVRRPWEPEPTALVVSIDRNNGEAVWEALQRTEPAQLIVAGAPGDDALWSSIERYCRDNDIALSYLNAETEIALDTLTLTILPPRDTDQSNHASFARITGNDTAIVVGLGGLPATGHYHLAIGSDEPPVRMRSEVALFASRNTTLPGAITLAPGESVRVRVDGAKLRIAGRPADAFDPR